MPTNPRDLIHAARGASFGAGPKLTQKLAEALEAALRDTERLDWFEANVSAVEIVKRRLAEAPTLRDAINQAIDAARGLP